MKHRALLLLFGLLFLALPVVAADEKQPPSILSIIPAQGEPGVAVTLSGAGFGERSSVFLGNNEIPARVLSPKLLTFEIPKLAPGQYALYIRRDDGSVSKAYSFMVQPLKPVLTGLTPDSVAACSTGREREVVVSGKNFQEGAQVLFDGAAIRTRFLSSGSVSFLAPQVAGGLHQVQVRNPEETVSSAQGLLIDTKPEIGNISRGEESVNYYNLIIEGRNFQQNSTVVVMEERTYEASGQPPQVDVKRLGSGMSGGAERDRTIYVNCNRIIYQRSPYSPVDKSLRVQVISPTGEESQVVYVSAP